MSTTRTTLLICATLFASIFGVSFYGYQQDQFVISSGANYVAIFDKKSRLVNICDRGNCTLVAPRFPESESHSPAMQNMKQLGSFASRMFNPQQAGGQQGMPQQGPNGQRFLGSFPQQMPTNPQMNPQMMPQTQQGNMAPQQMGTPQMMSSPQMNPQMVRPQMISGTPQAANLPAADEVKADDAAPDEADEETVPV